MSEPSSEHDQHQRRRVAAFRHAATVHDQVAELHETAADIFDQFGKHELAEHERYVAARYYCPGLLPLTNRQAELSRNYFYP
jgi:hypothetical protein